MKKWSVRPKANSKYYAQFPDISKTILDLLYYRIPRTKEALEEFFHPDYEKDVHDPFIFCDMQKAVARVFEAISRKEKIAIFGDYDVDGITSSNVLWSTLSELGAKLEIYIPDRKQEGYGMNKNALKILKEKKVKLILTVDCGIRDLKEAEQAKKIGIDLIITDHHLPGEILPEAFAIINPKVKGEKYPFKELAGVGVAFKFASAIIKKASRGKFIKGYEKWLLDLVALGTIADMVPLVGENRTLVKYGLIVLSKTKREGIKAIFNSAKVPLSPSSPPNSNQIGFFVAPRLNAAGRMDHANSSFELLRTKITKKATQIAEELEEKNSRRQHLTDKIVKEVEARINLKNKLVFEGDESWPVGILGLVAGKICEKYARPAFIYHISGAGKCQGSIRSIKEFKVVKNLEEIKELLSSFGGHDFAGGFSFDAYNKEKIKRNLNRLADQKLREEDLILEIEIDKLIKLKEINWDLYNELKKMEPFGMGNASPLFLAKGVELFQCNMVGNGNKHLKMWLKEDGQIFESIAFGKGEEHSKLISRPNTKVDIVFEISSDEWNGEKKLQLYVRDLRLSSE